MARKGRRSKKTSADVTAQEMRQEKVAGLYVRNVRLKDICAECDISMCTLMLDLATIRKRWRESAQEDWLERVTNELAKLDAIESEAWSKWEKSQGQVKVRTEKEKPTGPETEVKTSTCIGDPRFLEIVLSCSDRRRKMLGLDAPSKVEATIKNESGPPPTREQMRDEVRSVIERMRTVQQRASVN